MRPDGLFVKTNKLAMSPEALKSANTRICLVDKLTEKGGKTKYVCKKSVSKEINPYLVVMQAVLADLTRRIFPGLTAKTRVWKSAHDNVHLLSKYTEFIPAIQLAKSTRLNNLVVTNKGGLAKLMMCMIACANPDLHTSNWGITDKDEIFMIDFDHALPSLSESYLPENQRLTDSIIERLLTHHPNTIYSAHEFLEIISADDIRHSPFFFDAKPYNHPFCFTETERYTKNDKLDIDPVFGSLKQDPEYKKWLYYYATKFFLLAQDDYLKLMIENHSIGDEHADNKLFVSIRQHRERVYAAFIQIKEYRDFVRILEIDPILHQRLECELAESNNEFCDKNGIPKPHKASRCFNMQQIFSLLYKLKNEIENYEKTQTPQQLIEIQISLCIDRILQTLSVLEKFNVIFVKEREKLSDFKAFSKRCRNINHMGIACFPVVIVELKEFVTKHNLCKDKNIDFSGSLEKEFLTVGDCFSRLKKHIYDYQSNLISWKSNQEKILMEQIGKLFTLRNDAISLTIDEKILYMLRRIFSIMPAKNIPSEIYKYLESKKIDVSLQQNNSTTRFSFFTLRNALSELPEHNPEIISDLK